MQLHTPMSGNRTITLAEINAQGPGLENREVDEIIVESAADWNKFRSTKDPKLPSISHKCKLVFAYRYRQFSDEDGHVVSEHITSIINKSYETRILVFTHGSGKYSVRGAIHTFDRIDVIDHAVAGFDLTCSGAHHLSVPVITYRNIEDCTPYLGNRIVSVYGGSIQPIKARDPYAQSIFIYDQTKPVVIVPCVYEHAIYIGSFREIMLDNFTEATLILNVVNRMTIIGSKSEVRSRLILRATFIGELVIKNADVTLLNTPECREVTLVNSSCTGEPLTTLLRFTASGSSGRFLDQRVNPPSCRDITPEASWTYEDGAFQFPEARAFPVESDLEIIYEPDDPDMYLE